jgi:hypothetical protein
MVGRLGLIFVKIRVSVNATAYKDAHEDLFLVDGFVRMRLLLLCAAERCREEFRAAQHSQETYSRSL